MKYRYKFLYERPEGIQSQHGSELWKIGQWQKTTETPKLCRSGYHCSKGISQAFKYIQGDILAKVEVRGDSDISDDKECYQEMRIVKAYRWTKKDSVALAIYSAELVLDNYERWNPKDKSVRNAIEAAKRVLEDDTEENRSAAGSAARSAARSAADSAADSAAGSAYSAYSAAYSAARSADSAARSADSAAYSAYSAAYSAYSARSARSAAYSAAGSADSAAYSAYSDITTKIEKWMKAHIKEMGQIK
jgi:hypothetical protein